MKIGGKFELLGAAGGDLVALGGGVLLLGGGPQAPVPLQGGDFSVGESCESSMCILSNLNDD